MNDWDRWHDSFYPLDGSAGKRTCRAGGHGPGPTLPMREPVLYAGDDVERDGFVVRPTRIGSAGSGRGTGRPEERACVSWRMRCLLILE